MIVDRDRYVTVQQGGEEWQGQKAGYGPVGKFLQKAAFRLRVETVWISRIRRLWLCLFGAQIGTDTHLPAINLNWPHQLRLGANCRLENGIMFKYDGPWEPGPSIVVGNRVFIGRHCEFNISERIVIGDDCLIASGCKFIDHHHGISMAVPMNVQECPSAAITIGSGVWLGVNVTVLAGVTIAEGAVVGAGAVVTKSIPEAEIWAGVPARKIGARKRNK